MVDEETVGRLHKECRERQADASAEEVAAAIAEVAKTISPNVRNPIGVLLRQVPKFFAGASFMEWREARFLQEEKHAQAVADAETYADDRDAFDKYREDAVAVARHKMPPGAFGAMVREEKQKLAVNEPQWWARLTQEMKDDEAELRVLRTVEASLALMSFEQWRAARREQRG
jgi:hypothetical protein